MGYESRPGSSVDELEALFGGPDAACDKERLEEHVHETPLKPEDVRTWTKEKAAWRLHQAELTYLYARGWRSLCGRPTKPSSFKRKLTACS